MSADVWFEMPQAVTAASAIAIGNFDGVHLGHQALLGEMAQYASAHNLVPTALTFDPHPAAIVAPERLPQMICTVEERVRLLQLAGAQRVIVLPFTRELSQMTPRDFVKETLVNRLRAQAVFVGESFRFGHRQAGHSADLAELGKEFNFVTSFLSPITVRGQVVSSSKVRRLIQEGKVEKAGRMLGRCFSLTGNVVPGRQIGSTQTVPTLNLAATPGLVVPRGVYVTHAASTDESVGWAAITNVGTRPTFSGEDLTIETYLLDSFDGRTPRAIEVKFLHFLRPEKKFSGAEELKQQILRDVARAQSYWRRRRRNSGRMLAKSIY